MNQEKINNYLDKGADIISAGVGGALTLIGGPIATIGGGMLGVLIAQGIKGIASHKLSNKQNLRISMSIDYMLSEINKRLIYGEFIRQDIFDNNKASVSAEELFEGTILKCKDEYQEKKIYYISKIFEKTIFDQNVSFATANQILNIAEKFTYQKICILAFFGKINKFDKELILKCPYSWYENAKYTIDTEILQQDIFELINLGVLDNGGCKVSVKADIFPNFLELTPIGNVLFSLMDLNEIDIEELSSIYELLKYKTEYGKCYSDGRSISFSGTFQT